MRQYLLYVLLSAIVGLGLAAALDIAEVQQTWLHSTLFYLVAVPAILMLSTRAGSISPVGLAVTSIALVLAAQAASVYILNHIAVPAGGSVGWRELYTPAHRSHLLLNAAIAVAAPLGWLWALRRLGLAANNSFKPRPLRGSA